MIKEFKSKSSHKYSLILLHGMNMPIKELYNITKILQKKYIYLKIIIPVANKMNIFWPEGLEYNVRSWYNYYTRNDNQFVHDTININDFNYQTNNIFKIIDNERKILKNSKNIIIAGISQGGTLAFNIGLNYFENLGGIIGIHTIFMDNIIKINNNCNKIPIYLFSGSKDKIYNIKFQDISLNKLREKKYKIFWCIKKLHHCEYSKYEQGFLFNSINHILGI